MAGLKTRASRKRPDRYHHGDLRRALLGEAAKMIHTHGVAQLTLRAVGSRLGVSRTALYRHFADKATLLAGVAREGFQTLRTALVAAWEMASGGFDGLDAMGVAYVQFATANPGSYRVMFGGFVDSGVKDPEFVQEAASAFEVLVDALIALQHDALVRRDDPRQLARYVWATVHGVAMLGIDGQLQHQQADVGELTRYAIGRLHPALAIQERV